MSVVRRPDNSYFTAAGFDNVCGAQPGSGGGGPPSGLRAVGGSAEFNPLSAAGFSVTALAHVSSLGANATSSQTNFVEASCSSSRPVPR